MRFFSRSLKARTLLATNVKKSPSEVSLSVLNLAARSKGLSRRTKSSRLVSIDCPCSTVAKARVVLSLILSSDIAKQTEAAINGTRIKSLTMQDTICRQSRTGQERKDFKGVIGFGCA